MRTFGSPFTLCLFEPSDVSRAEFDRALKIYRDNTSPLLRTRSNQIRAKAQSPKTSEGDFFFTGLLRAKIVVGFAMFGYYPAKCLMVIDHMAIDVGCRGENAFYAFAQLLSDAVERLELEVDFTAVEIEKNAVFGGQQTGGAALIRLLGHVGFGEVHADYRIADLEPGHDADGHPGTLMIRAAEKIHRIRKADLLAIHDGVLFDHYLPWCKTFLGERTNEYASYLSRLRADFAERLPDVVPVNGPEEDGLVPIKPNTEVSKFSTVKPIAGYVTIVLTATLMAFLLKIDTMQIIYLMLAVLVVYAGIDLVSKGKADEVFSQTLSKLPGGTHRSRYQPASRIPAPSRKLGPKRPTGSKN